jgi:hypothetical protein
MMGNFQIHRAIKEINNNTILNLILFTSDKKSLVWLIEVF